MEKDNQTKVPLGQSSSYATIDSFSFLKQKDIVDFFIQNGVAAEELAIRPKQYTKRDISDLKSIINHDKYFVQLGFVATQASIVSNCDFKYDIEQFTFSDAGVLNNAFKNSVTEYLLTPWQIYLGKELSELFLNSVISTLSLNNSVGYFYNKKIVALLYCYPSHDCSGQQLTQVGWVWIDPELDKSIREELKSHIVSWLKEYNAPLYQAGIHLFNVASHRFFESIGFKLQCAHIIKRR